MATVKETALIFVSMAAIVAGGLLIHLALWNPGGGPAFFLVAPLAIALVAAGLTSIWMSSIFYRKG